jgi:hypothetical protein
MKMRHRHVLVSETLVERIDRLAKGEAVPFAYCSLCGKVPTELVGEIEVFEAQSEAR